MSADGTAPDARQTGPSLPGPRAPEAITTAGARTVALAKLALAGEVADVRTPSPSSSRQRRRRTKEADHADAVTRPLPPGTTAAALKKPAESISPPELPSQEYDQVVLETHARRTVGEVLTAKGEKGAYVYDAKLRVRAALGVLPRKTELTGANGGPVPINWISSVDPHALRKATR